MSKKPVIKKIGAMYPGIAGGSGGYEVDDLICEEKVAPLFIYLKKSVLGEIVLF